MTAPVEQVRFALRRRTAAAWAALNEVLKKGEPGIEIDTKFGKTGDGVTAWNDLLYTFDGETDLSGLADGKAKIWDAASSRWKIGDAGKSYTAGAGIDIDTSGVISSTLGSIVVDAWVSVYADLPIPPPAGKSTYGVLADGLVYGWNGSAWPASGKGISINSNPATDVIAMLRMAYLPVRDDAGGGPWQMSGVIAGASSAKCDGNLGSIYGPNAITAALANSAAWTLEAFVQPTGNDNLNRGWGIFGASTETASDSRQGVYIETTGRMNFMRNASINGGTAFSQLLGTIPGTILSRHHIAVCFDGTKLYGCADGVLLGSVADTKGFAPTTGPFRLGLLTDAGSSFKFALNGFVDNARITLGRARYTANYAVPSTPLRAT